MKRNLFMLVTSSLLFLLMACSPSGPSTIKVVGKVVDRNTQPVGSAAVVITYGTTPTVKTATTDSSGNFTVDGVEKPYNASVVSGTTALVYKGLNRTDPTLVFLSLTLSTPSSATLSGTISGGAGFPEPANHKTRVAFASPEANDATTANTTTGAYSMGTVSWFGGATTTGTLHALQWLFDGTGLPTDYKGYGSKTGVALSNGGAFTGQNVALSGISEASVSGNVGVPTGYAMTSKAMDVAFANRARIAVLSDTSSSASFTYTTPNIAGATVNLTTTLNKGATVSVRTVKTGLAVNASGISINPVAGSELSLPATAATNVGYSNIFSWSQFVGGVHIVAFNSAGPDYIVITSDTSTSIPNLSSVGLALPASTPYTWEVFGIAPFASVDEAASTSTWVNTFLGATDGTISTSATRSFTTAP